MQFSLALLGFALIAAHASASPVERIVNLLKDLKATTEGDRKAEQQIYDKYACWCETTSTRKANDIVQAQADLRSLGQRILKLKGKVATRTAEIAELSDNIKANEDEQETLTSVREKQNAAWSAEADETKQAIAALQTAIKVLAGATTPGLMQVSEMMSKHAITSVLDTLPSKIGMSPARMALLSEFVSAKTGYAPQSATIQGMLGDMYLTFASNLQDATQDEADQNFDFEKMYATLEKENNQLKETRARKETEKAEAEAMLADTTKAYDDTEKQMKADIAFFDQTKSACKTKHEEWTVREGLRDEELKGIDAALEMLTSDEARALFATSIKPGTEKSASFLQVASTPALLQGSAMEGAARAYNALQAQVKKAHSIRLAALAVSIRSAKNGHFGAVIEAIDKMVATLNEEGAADLAKKEQCLDEYQDITKTVKDLDWKVKNNEAKIAKLEGLIELRTQEKTETIEKIEENEQAMKDMKAERKAEHEAYQQAKKDDQNAKALLEKAKAAFAEYFKKNAIKMGPIQGSATGLLQDPEFERSADDAPDASFTKKGSNKVASKGVISLFDYIIEDLTAELANEKTAEAESQADFEGELATAEQLDEDLNAKKVTLTGIIAKRNEDKKDENTDKKENNKDRTSELKYQAKIKPDCDWILGAFDGRAEARAAEMGGLTTAKEFLNGKTALIQSNIKPLSSIGFLGISK